MKTDVHYKVIGAMSGTSVDGLDLAYCDVKRTNGSWTASVLEAVTISYDEEWRKKLQDCMHLSGLELAQLDVDFGAWVGHRVLDFIQQHQLKPDFISAHGHTVFHQPGAGMTYQIGNGSALYQVCQLPVITDFRTLDVRFGGQGAPLVPIGDELIFSQFDACLNLGGIANISYKEGGERKALDICACNMLLNWLAQKDGKSYDKGGTMAQKGSLDKELLDELNDLAYFKLPPPKSLGLEWAEAEVFTLPRFEQLGINDALHTSCHHIAQQINETVKQFVHDQDGIVLVSGGGVYNAFLIDVLNEYRPGNIAYDIPDHHIVDFKEALVFALMGALRRENEINCLKSVTGATADVSGGVIYHNQYQP